MSNALLGSSFQRLRLTSLLRCLIVIIALTFGGALSQANLLERPVIVKIKDLSPNGLTVVWNADPAVHRYEVFVKGRGWEPASRRNRHHVAGLEACSKNNIRVRAVDAQGNASMASRKKTVHTPSDVPAPDNLSAMALGDTVYLEWDRVPGADDYRVTTARKDPNSNSGWQAIDYIDMIGHSPPGEILTWHVMEGLDGEYRFTVESVDYNCDRYNKAKIKVTLGWD